MAETKPITLILDKLMRELVDQGYKFFPSTYKVLLPYGAAEDRKPIGIDEFELIVVQKLNREVPMHKLKRAMARAVKYSSTKPEIVSINRAKVMG